MYFEKNIQSVMHNFLPILFGILILGIVGLTPYAFADFILTNESVNLIDFDDFLGNGFVSGGGGGSLDSDNWRILGLSDGDGTFGGTFNSGGFARGLSPGGAGSGGIYAFEITIGDNSLGFQPTSIDMNPGIIDFLITNGLDTPIKMNVEYDFLFFDDGDRSSSFDFQYSLDGIIYTPLSHFETPEFHSSPIWISIHDSSNLNLVSIDSGHSIYLRWITEDISGSGVRDEMAINNLSIQAISLSDTIDSDGDGVTDLYDKCPGFDDNFDIDSDGAPDACDSNQDAFTAVNTGEWSNPNVWQGGIVPGSDDPAEIRERVIITNNGIITIDSDLNIYGTLVNYGTITNRLVDLVSIGIITNYGNLNNNGELNNNAELDNFGDINNNIDGILNNSHTIENKFGSLNNYGLINNEGSLFEGEINNYGEINNDGGIRTDPELFFNNFGLIKNNFYDYQTLGSIEIPGLMNNNLDGLIDNYGQIKGDGEIDNSLGVIKNHCVATLDLGVAGNPPLQLCDLYVTSQQTQEVLRYDGVTGQFRDVFVSQDKSGITAGWNDLAFYPYGDLYLIAGAIDAVYKVDGITGQSGETFVCCDPPNPGDGGLDTPTGVTFGYYFGNLYVTSSSTNEVLRYNGPFDESPGSFDSVFVTAGNGGLNNPSDLTFGPDGSLYVLSRQTHEVLRFAGPNELNPGEFQDVFVSSGSGGLSFPYSIAFGPDKNLYVGTPTNGILKYIGPQKPLQGTFDTVFVPPGSGGLDGPSDITFGPDDNLYVTDSGGDQILRFKGPFDASPGSFDIEFVTAGSGGLNMPTGLAFGETIPDKDGDGIGDEFDNCPATPNNDQLDSEGDGVGNVCDSEPFYFSTVMDGNWNDPNVWEGGIVPNSDSPIINFYYLTILNTDIITQGNRINNYGNFEIFGEMSLEDVLYIPDGEVNIHEGGSLSTLNGGRIDIINPGFDYGIINNYGEILFGFGCVDSKITTLNNYGDLLLGNCSLVNQGTLENLGGTIELASSILNYGIMTNDCTGIINFSQIDPPQITENPVILTCRPSLDDYGFNGNTNAFVIFEGDQELTITEEPYPDGIRITTGAGTGAPAQISVCDGLAEAFVGDSSEVRGTCGSVTLESFSGTTTVNFLVDGIVVASTSLETGDNVTFDDELVEITNNGSNSVTFTSEVDGSETILNSGESSVVVLPVDSDGDGTPDFLDTDDDNDGILDEDEIAFGLNPLVADIDSDTDGIYDQLDLDVDTYSNDFAKNADANNGLNTILHRDHVIQVLDMYPINAMLVSVVEGVFNQGFPESTSEFSFCDGNTAVEVTGLSALFTVECGSTTLGVLGGVVDVLPSGSSDTVSVTEGSEVTFGDGEITNNSGSPATISINGGEPIILEPGESILLNHPPTAHPSGPYLTQINTNLTLDASASTDPDGLLDIATYKWDLDGDGEFNDATGISPQVQFDTAGVITIGLEVTDLAGATSTATTMVVVYDPEGGFVSGSGWIDSPEGSCNVEATADVCNFDVTGKATFGFVSKYQKGAVEPSGNTQFHFKAGNLNFKSSDYEWLTIVIAGAKAQYKGTGTINGEGEFGFILTAFDADYNNNDSHTEDKFRIKIWDKANGDEIVYDNKMGESDDYEDATEIGGGSIVIHKGN